VAHLAEILDDIISDIIQHIIQGIIGGSGRKKNFRFSGQILHLVTFGILWLQLLYLATFS